jgi:hypothetical protein
MGLEFFWLAIIAVPIAFATVTTVGEVHIFSVFGLIVVIKEKN